MCLPFLVIIVGIVWLLNNVGVISTNLWSIILPVAVILAGISMLSKKNCSWCKPKNQENKQ